MAKGNARKFINDIHLWLGLGSGIVLFLVCLSGTIYTFRTEIEERLNREVYFVKDYQGKQALSLDSLLATVEKSTQNKISAVTIPSNAEKAWSFSAKPKGKEGGRGKTILVNPYTGTIAGDTQTGSSRFFMTVMKMHRWLLMEQGTGRIIVGVATVIFALMLLSGIILWLPRRFRYWKQGLTILFRGKWKRINHDLHNTLGFYAFIFLLIMALTGLCWSFEGYRSGASKILGAEIFGSKKEKPVQAANSAGMMLSPDAALKIAAGQLNYAGVTRLGFPEAKTVTFTVSKNNSNAWNTAAADKLVIDAYSGSILKKEAFASKTTGQKIAASIRSIHTGEIYGMFSKIIYFICCLIATSLPVTGTFIWINKMKKKKPGPSKIPAAITQTIAVQ
ncbi:PepSY-associated TM helix domain-containing protein [Niabella soli]|uniref:Sulfite reductase n=1 Tax=Niabella soli DSM 19437 TaxID=929713 RepID=W0ET88_9BACT|nr:PepSY-associated TM helix domain-containing protein [Niabella soli]AHF14045.1 sulfite reductase [Niabella soli DSM 19437]